MKKKLISILIVPDSKDVRSYNIPSWLPKILTITIVSISIVLGFTLYDISSSYNFLQKEHKNTINELENLEEDNKSKDKEINYLISQTKEVEIKLKKIDALQKKLENMAGVNQTSRSSLQREIPNNEGFAKEDLEKLNERLDEKELELREFITDMEKQFESLKYIPNLKPVNGRLTSTFGYRISPFKRGVRAFHYGIDLANNYGTEIKAAANGTVVFSGWRSSYGKTIIIDHGNGYKTLYAHNKSILANPGETVEKGQTISYMGSTGRSTGCHLHFEIHKNGVPINPLEMLK